ncbi:MAG: hypothetical protein JXR07_14270 [Reichenbachiella sp.]
MDYLVFKTNVSSKIGVDQLKPILNTNPVIIDWWVDTKDIDKVLRIKASVRLKESEVVKLLEKEGFYCEVLND